MTDLKPYDPSIREGFQILEEIIEPNILEIIPDSNEINRLKPSTNKYRLVYSSYAKNQRKQTTG